MRVGLDDDLYEKLDKIGERLGVTTDSLIELAVEQLIKEIDNTNK